MSVDGRATVFLLAQNRLLREALSKILSKKECLHVIGSSALTHDSLQEIAVSSPDVLVIDSFTSNIAHLEFAREIQQRLPVIKLVMIGMEADGQPFLQAIREGAMGYVVKDASALEVVAAVRTVATGGAFCSPELCAFLFRFAAQQNQMPSFYARTRLGLTNREQQLVGLISQGLTNKEIANRLQLAEQTVRNHVHRMLRKLGASHRLAVVDICRTEGISV
ncbi:MAG TPA: response regulator transcription factor [Terriglobales bacterium]|nr:response regulator transcription factor [Terriglobales bacterium]